MRSLFLALISAVCVHAHASTDWEHWLKLPTAANAAKVQTIEYTALLSEVEAGPRVTRDLQTLAKHVRAGELPALRLAFRLSNTTAPGANLEDIHEMLGAAARPHTRRLLQALKNTPDVHGCPGVDFLGPKYVDQLELRRTELAARRMALQSIAGPDFVAEQAKCLAALKDDA